jgi:hypothetical protein
VLPVPEPIPGTSFFPGGYGLWHPKGGFPLPRFPIGGIMILGHDFHSESGYRASLARGRESATQPTWRNLVDLLGRAEVPVEECFFTNYYMGLRAGTATTGMFPGADDAGFVSHCREFFLEQVRTQRPRVILTLGIHVPPGIAPLSPQLALWNRKRGLLHLDAAGPVQPNVSFSRLPDFATTVVALTHPSQRQASVRHRRYKQLAGDAAELLMLREARDASE